MFKRLVAKYEQERVDRLQSVETLTKRIQAIKQTSDNSETWAKLIKQYTRLETLDTSLKNGNNVKKALPMALSARPNIWDGRSTGRRLVMIAVNLSQRRSGAKGRPNRCFCYQNVIKLNKSTPKSLNFRAFRGCIFYSHSIVAGGLEVISYTTRLTNLTWFTILAEMFPKISCGILAQSAVIKSLVVTPRKASV